MAVLCMESFESLRFTLGSPWNYGAGLSGLARNAAAAKTGSYGILTNGIGETYDFSAIYGNKQTVIASFHYKSVLGLGDAFCRLNQGGSNQLTIGTGLDGSIKVWRGSEAGTLLGSSSNVGLITTGNWCHVEIKAKCDNATGTIEVRVNNVTALTLEGIDTQATANAYFTSVTLCGPDGTNSAMFDNFVLMDTSGTRFNDFMGEGELLSQYVSGAGSLTQWTPSAGSNYQNVDEAGSHDSDTTYNSSSTPGQEDAFAVQDLSVTGGTVAAVELLTFARKDDAGTRQVAQVINLGGGRSQRATQTLSTSYAAIAEIFEVDPADNSTLTASKVNAAEIGYVEVA